MNNLFDQFLKKFIGDCRLKVVFGGVFWSFFTFFQKFSRAKSLLSLSRFSEILSQKNCTFVREYGSKFFQNWPFLAYFFI